MTTHLQPLHVRPVPQRSDDDTAWQTLAAPLPTVRAEIQAMAASFTLASDSRGVWTASNADLDLAIDIVAVADGAHAAVGVRIGPPKPVALPSRWQPYRALAGLVLAPLWLLLAFALWLASTPLQWLLLAPTGVVLLLSLVGAGFIAVGSIGEHVTQRAEQRARDQWRARFLDQRFWPTLTARVAERQGYR